MKQILLSIMILAVGVASSGCTSPPNGGGVSPAPWPAPAPQPAPTPVVVDDAVLAAKIAGLRNLQADRQWNLDRAALLDVLADTIGRNRDSIQTTNDVRNLTERIGSIRFAGQSSQYPAAAQQIEEIVVAQLGGLDFRSLEPGEIDELIEVYRAIAAALRG